MTPRSIGQAESVTTSAVLRVSEPLTFTVPGSATVTSAEKYFSEILRKGAVGARAPSVPASAWSRSFGSFLRKVERLLG